MQNEESPTQLNPAALSVTYAARMLTKVGGQTVSDETVRADLAAGAPSNPDGTINLVHYGAWLAKEMGHGD